MKRELNVFLCAVTFLTRLPVSRFVQHDPEHLSKSSLYFPLVGFLVGATGAFAFWLASLKCSPTIAVLLSIATTILLTGAFHEDGLADSADGFGGGYSKERVLEIMKDSRIGTFGAVALWLFLSAKLLTLSEIAAQSPREAMLAMMSAHLLGRYSSLPLIFALNYARAQETSSKPFAEKISAARLALASLYVALLCVLLLERRAIVAIGATLFVAWMSGKFFRAKNRRNHGRRAWGGKSTFGTCRLRRALCA